MAAIEKTGYKEAWVALKSGWTKSIEGDTTGSSCKKGSVYFLEEYLLVVIRTGAKTIFRSAHQPATSADTVVECRKCYSFCSEKYASI